MVGLVAAVLAPLGPSPSYARGVEPAAHVATGHRLGLLARIERLGIVDSVREVPSLALRGTRFFRIWYRLPVDHDDPDGATFRLRGTLIHRGTDRPTVFSTSGYGIRTWDFPYLTEPTRIVEGNQLDLEHRFFRPSRPADPDWAAELTIRQAAADQHRVIRAMQRIYREPWLSTGISKGGMTVTYERRFHPGDVAGTIAYVAPDDAVDADDVYGDFQATVGGPAYAECRAALAAVQRRILERRDWFVARYRTLVQRRHDHLALVGGADRAVEIAAVEVYFAFWQYQPAAEMCSEVPGPDASNRSVWSFVDYVLDWGFLTDEGLRYYVPYYFQAATQLGAPDPYEDNVADLLRHPGHDVPATFVPDRLEPLTFDASAMPDVDSWVRTSSSRMLYVYGELDPWSAEPFDCGDDGAARQCSVHVVPGGNHGSDLAQLPRAERRAAVAQVRAWAGLSGQPASPISSASASSAECGVGAPCRARWTVPAPETAIATPTATAAAPNQNGAWTPWCSASFSATYGPTAPPVKRTNE